MAWRRLGGGAELPPQPLNLLARALRRELSSGRAWTDTYIAILSIFACTAAVILSSLSSTFHHLLFLRHTSYMYVDTMLQPELHCATAGHCLVDGVSYRECLTSWCGRCCCRCCCCCRNLRYLIACTRVSLLTGSIMHGSVDADTCCKVVPQGCYIMVIYLPRQLASIGR